jgi:hypothetical protein
VTHVERERRAVSLLEHPESYPGLAIRERARVKLRVWRYPSFEPFASWAVLQASGSLFVRRVLWDQAQMQLPEPVTYGSEAPCEEAVFGELIAKLASIALPPFVVTGGIGLDGTRCGVAVEDNMSSFCANWWEEHPHEWAPLREWHAKAVAALERVLPSPTVGAQHVVP